MELNKLDTNFKNNTNHNYYEDIIRKVSDYDSNLKINVLIQAVDFSRERHSEQKRDSGDPYFFHPLAVANILADYKLDWVSIITALLHDTVEDGVATRAEIRKLFGAEIARLVDGVTKLSKIEAPHMELREAENFRKFLLAMSKDIRVLLVKLADRLHNMRTLKYIDSSDRRRRISKETLDVYAPLAARIGMQNMREELEDIAFAELNTSIRKSLNKRILFLRNQDDQVVKKIIREIKYKFKLNKKIIQIQGREKSIYSIWKKMQKSSISFENISDIYAFRIICDDISDCYAALGIIHNIWPMIPGRFKDYISTPKSNGYSSIHTNVIGPLGRPIEIQIRTQKMHELNEYGVAAHWYYKEKNSTPVKLNKVSLNLFKEFSEIIGNSSGADDLLSHSKMEMYSDQVFCFTPKGEVITMPKTATPIDFAFSVHSKLGETCVGCKINGRAAPLQTILSNGDQVEILRSNSQTPQPSWLNYTVTGKARSYINKFIRKNDRNEFIKLGRSILENNFILQNKQFHDKLIDPILKQLDYKSRRSLYFALGKSEINSDEVLNILLPKKVNTNKIINLNNRKDRGISIKGLKPGVAIHMGECCHPLFGERIVGLMTEGKGITVHTLDCVILERYTDNPELWVDLTWNKKSSENNIGRINVTITNKRGSLNTLTQIIADFGGNITNFLINQRSDDFFQLSLDIEVNDAKHLNEIITGLRTNLSIYEVNRAKENYN
ncbi:MAG: bifunctional (p)ppGpp synthetase/guanosine-3',5'-bis(diphosphate) 3'-pyrophosphohydrolase [Pelagibacterales bacterium]|nr:bifunctional (p)ppGpp synthetase/guanosine-3',5'-bis(diphosphate) 3'-pyrophosphohydrolase [Pelagibacterales bacterium]|tara:strand:+ start:60284 stop:62458 length:2175 start_codon:yes stop_codon:yes gene_type:complete